MNLALQLHYNQMKTFDDILGIKRRSFDDDAADTMRYGMQKLFDDARDERIRNTPKLLVPRGATLSELGVMYTNGGVKYVRN